MKLTITHLKAPWPEGAKVGDVLELPSVPAWALGKSQPAEDDAEVTLVMPEAPAPSEQVAVVRDPLEELRADHAAELALAESRIEKAKELACITYENLRADHAAELAELQAKLDAANAERDSLAAELAAARAEFVSGSISEEANSKTLDKTALKAEAKALGLEFDGRMPAAELAELIAAKKAEQQ